jgi:hypothetical protein
MDLDESHGRGSSLEVMLAQRLMQESALMMRTGEENYRIVKQN